MILLAILSRLVVDSMYRNRVRKIVVSMQICRIYQNIIQRFVSFCISLIFTYFLSVEKKLVTIKISFLTFLGGQNVWQNGNFSLYFENSWKGPIFKASDES